jgi:archaellum component FlaC
MIKRKKPSRQSRPKAAPAPASRQRLAKSEKTQMATNNSRKNVSGDAKGVMTDADEAFNLPTAGDAPGVDKIRELLFGNQMQDYDRRFTVMEDRFTQKVREIEGESARSLASLESSMKKQLESMAAQFRNEKDVLAEADKTLERSLREQIQTLEKRLGQASDQLGKLEREFMERLERASQALRDESRKRSEDTHKTIERMFAELSSVKTDRNLLAGLFVEIARCLNQDAMPKGSMKGANADSR